MLNFKQGIMLRFFLTSLIGFVSFLGDKGLQRGKTEIVRAISDNLTHATVGGITWTLVVVSAKKSVVENFSRILACFLMSSLIDVDHFIAAGSWDINDATHIHYRPFFHNTSLPIALWILMFLISKLTNAPNLIIYAWMMFVSFISHHVRDANRRGLWFWPFGSTQPIPYFWYLAICMALPYFVQYMMEWQLAYDINKSYFII